MPGVLHDLIAGVLAGLLSVFLIIYGFQPNRPYPSWILEPAEQPWIFILILVSIVYIIQWDYTIGLMALLCVIAIVFDLIIFTNSRQYDSKDSEALYTPSIGLIPNMITEVFDNQNTIPQVLPKDEQVSKKWTVNYEPTINELNDNQYTSGNDTNKMSLQSGLPLSDDSLDMTDHYPIFY